MTLILATADLSQVTLQYQFIIRGRFASTPLLILQTTPFAHLTLITITICWLN